MHSFHVKLGVGAALLAAAMGYLGFAGLKSGWVYFVSVDQFLAGQDAAHHRARIHGIVAPDADIRPAALVARFKLVGESASLPVEYHGAVPDLFQPGREVVVEGVLDSQGVLQADVLMTKCASKYEDGAAHPPHGPESHQ
jgi:cytochrome c-type biogenesis protein CcmE